MATTNPLLDDLAGLMTGAMGAARTAGDEARTAMRARLEAMIADMDLAGRDEVETLKQIAPAALEKAEGLAARIEALESASKPKRSASKAAD